MFPMRDLSPTVSMEPSPGVRSSLPLHVSPSSGSFSSFTSLWDGLRNLRNSVVSEEKVNYINSNYNKLSFHRLPPPLLTLSTENWSIMHYAGIKLYCYLDLFGAL